MPYNEFRKDYLLNRWVVIATERSRRPTDFAKGKNEATKNRICPMCVGNEAMTPAAIMLYLTKDGEVTRTKDPLQGERPKNWLVRTIPNLYPAFSPPKEKGDENQILKNDAFGHAIGEHEVLVESPNHDEHPADAKLPQLELVLKAYIDRISELSMKPYIKHVSVFRNHGQEAGASLSHAHSQIIATPTIPTLIQEEIDASKKFFKEKKKCVFCDLIERESNSPRAIINNKDFLVLAPYASINPMEFWVLPKKHASNILNLGQKDVSAFAQVLKASLKGLKDLVKDPPYNYGLHLTLDKSFEDCYHWHLEVYPKLSIWAGFEKSTSVYINTVTPETAAAELKKVIEL